MVCILQQMPIQRARLAPFAVLRKFTAHKQQLFPRMPHHEAIGKAQIRKALPDIPRHFPNHRGFCMYHLIMRKHQHKILRIMICHAKGQLILMIFSINRVKLDIGEEIIHPAHVPFQAEPKTALINLLRHTGPCGAVLRNHECARLPLGNDGIHVLEKFDCLKVFTAAVYIRQPLSLLLAEIQPQKRCHRIHAQPVYMENIHPIKRICKQEIRNLFSAVIEDIRPPLDMLPQTGVLMLIKRRAVKACQCKIILREMRRHPVQNDGNAVLMAGIHKLLKFVRTAIAARRGIIARHLIAPAAVKGMLLHRQHLDMRIAHFLHIGNQLLRQLRIAQKTIALRPFPAA